MCYFNPLLIILSGNLRGVLSVIVELLQVPLGGVLLQVFPCPQARQVNPCIKQSSPVETTIVYHPLGPVYPDTACCSRLIDWARLVKTPLTGGLVKWNHYPQTRVTAMQLVGWGSIGNWPSKLPVQLT